MALSLLISSWTSWQMCHAKLWLNWSLPHPHCLSPSMQYTIHLDKKVYEKIIGRYTICVDRGKVLFYIYIMLYIPLTNYICNRISRNIQSHNTVMKILSKFNEGCQGQCGNMWLAPTFSIFFHIFLEANPSVMEIRLDINLKMYLEESTMYDRDGAGGL